MTRARGRRWARALGVLALFVLAFWLTGCDPAAFWARRVHLRDIVSQLFPPDWSYLSAIVAPLLATRRCARPTCRARRRCAGFCGFWCRCCARSRR